MDELEGFRLDTSAVSQFLLSYLAVHAVAARSPPTVRALNRQPLFWNTALAALQQAGIVALGRVFDQNSPHNIDSLMRVTERNREIFEKGALAARKLVDSPDANRWLPDYLASAHVSNRTDFRRLRRQINMKRRVYNAQFRDIRNKIFAHREISDAAGVEKLFSQTRLRDLERIALFLNQLHEALWHAFYNGRRPALRPMPYSARSLARRRLDETRNNQYQLEIVRQVRGVLRLIRASP